MEISRHERGETAKLTFQRAAIWLALAAFLFLVWQSASVLFVLFAGLIVAAVFSASADALNRFLPGRRTLALVIVYVIFFTLIFGVIAYAGAAIALDFQDLRATLTEQVKGLAVKLEEMGFIQDSSSRDSIREMWPDSFSAMTSINRAFGMLGNLLVILFIGGFVAWNPSVYRRGIVSLFPESKRDVVRSTLIDAGCDLRSWLKGQGLAMLTVFIVSWLVLWMIGMPYAFTLALQAALLAFIQTIGPAIAGIVIVLVGLSVSASMAIWGFAAYVVIQTVESNLTTPLIQRSIASIPPALSLGSQIIFGALFGLIGLALAVPFMRVVMTFVQRLYVERTLGGYASDEGSDSDESVTAH